MLMSFVQSTCFGDWDKELFSSILICPKFCNLNGFDKALLTYCRFCLFSCLSRMFSKLSFSSEEDDSILFQESSISDTNSFNCDCLSISSLNSFGFSLNSSGAGRILEWSLREVLILVLVEIFRHLGNKGSQCPTMHVQY